MCLLSLPDRRQVFEALRFDSLIDFRRYLRFESWAKVAEHGLVQEVVNCRVQLIQPNICRFSLENFRLVASLLAATRHFQDAYALSGSQQSS